ncbi:MAG: hypothetical protein BWY47_01308 [Bacteroidetes bacterium ADurb.Bin302]|nr:MAG: hypothetical protein BWY47_01308 [Bacteroidetes bacterium ADurb.Bin302]
MEQTHIAPIIKKPVDKIVSELEFLSSIKRIIDSFILQISIGTTKLAIVIIKSAVPYSSLDSTPVYKGTKKKAINFVPKLPSVNIKVFLAKYFSLEFDLPIFLLPYLPDAHKR